MSGTQNNQTEGASKDTTGEAHPMASTGPSNDDSTANSGYNTPEEAAKPPSIPLFGSTSARLFGSKDMTSEPTNVEGDRGGGSARLSSLPEHKAKETNDAAVSSDMEEPSLNSKESPTSSKEQGSIDDGTNLGHEIPHRPKNNPSGSYTAPEIDDSDTESEDLTAYNAETFARQTLLKKFDSLLKCGLRKTVDVPELIVVGNQSSGKSSVLEGLTKLPFPRDRTVCTRFATQITFRREMEQKVSIRIKPGDNASKEHREKLERWSRDEVKELGASVFIDIVEEAKELMGVGSAGGSVPRNNFSEDVLQIDISGPDEQHLTITDIPGKFYVTDGTTVEKDVKMVDDIIKMYMKNSRCIMLAVMPCADIATQEILPLAKEFDPRLERTLGVLTKPDLSDLGTEGDFINMTNGVTYPMSLGWHVVRNPGHLEVYSSSRAREDAEKRFFETKGGWSDVPFERRGISQLWQRIQAVLTRHIAQEFPHVQNDIDEQLSKVHVAIRALGPERSSTREQRNYLTEIHTEYDRIKADARNAQYRAPHFSNSLELRLPTLIRERNDCFTKDMQRYGNMFAWESGQEVAQGLTAGLFSRQVVFSQLHEFLVPKVPTNIECKAGIMEWLVDQHRISKGWELGGFNPALVDTLFCDQASNWDLIAKNYLSDIVELVHSFITGLFNIVAPDPHVRAGIMAKLIDPIRASYRRAFQHVDFLLSVEGSGIGMTTNKAYEDHLRTASVLRAKRTEERARTANQSVLPEHAKSKPVASPFGEPRPHPPEKAPSSTTKSSASNWFSTIESSSAGAQEPLPAIYPDKINQLHDQLQAYYLVARDRFVDNMQMQVALYHLIAGPDSPLSMFSASFIVNLTDGELEAIAGEHPGTKAKRAELERELQRLEMAAEILRS